MAMHNPQLPNREAVARPDDAIQHLTDFQEQADMHGERVTVSRQALDEVLAFVALIPSPDQGEAAAKVECDVCGGSGRNNSHQLWPGCACRICRGSGVIPSAAPPVDSAKPGEELSPVDAIKQALEAWKALPDDERNGERPYVMGFNAGWEAALSASLPEPQLGVER